MVSAPTMVSTAWARRVKMYRMVQEAPVLKEAPTPSPSLAHGERCAAFSAG